MLVLNRKESERILIRTKAGEEIWLMVVEVRGSIARIGIEAPDSAAVIRDELLKTDTEKLRRQMREQLKARAKGSPAPVSGEETPQGSGDGES